MTLNNIYLLSPNNVGQKSKQVTELSPLGIRRLKSRYLLDWPNLDALGENPLLDSFQLV